MSRLIDLWERNIPAVVCAASDPKVSVYVCVCVCARACVCIYGVVCVCMCETLGKTEL